MARDCLDCPDSDNCNALVTGICTQTGDKVDMENATEKCREFNEILVELETKIHDMKMYDGDISVSSIRDAQEGIVKLGDILQTRLYPKTMELFDAYASALEDFRRKQEE